MKRACPSGTTSRRRGRTRSAGTGTTGPVWTPGRGHLGYRLGWRKLWQLRERAEQALGAGFDVRDFHELVLGSGALPLTAVEDNVERWITSR
ncbi:DUF885 family protein [Amycolatopsis sp. NBC_00345]|uniref:DUF885 family protein n=1 Tax=Amycolatopsis sp. NBC_00345 TaxID=2975955 RepID=UPI003FA488B5